MRFSLTRGVGAATTAVALGVVLAACSGAPATQAPTQAPTQGTQPTAAPPSPTAAAACDGFPARDVELVVPYSPGGGFDTWARMVAPYLQKNLPNTVNVVVTNKSGAGGLVGVTEVYGSPADGYKIAITEPGVLVTQQIAGTTEVDPTRLRAIGRFAVSPEVIFIAEENAHGWETIEDVQAYAESQPVIMSHGGVAAVNVVSMQALGLPYTGIFHEGSSESVLSVVRGDGEIAVFTWTSMIEHIQAGDIKPVVIVGTKDPEIMPAYELAADVPSLDEASGQEGLGAALEQHRILVAPPETPDCVIDILSDAFVSAMEDPALVAEAEAAELLPVPLGAEETQQIIQNTYDSLQEYADLIRAEVED